MPRLACGLATRTHGVRPSEETAFRVISGSFPLRRLIGPSTPAEGRAPHARKEGSGLTRGMSPLRPRALVDARGGMKCLGLRAALPRGRTECVPPRKPAPTLSRVLPGRPSQLG